MPFPVWFFNGINDSCIPEKTSWELMVLEILTNLRYARKTIINFTVIVCCLLSLYLIKLKWVIICLRMYAVHTATDCQHVPLAIHTLKLYLESVVTYKDFVLKYELEQTIFKTVEEHNYSLWRGLIILCLIAIFSVWRSMVSNQLQVLPERLCAQMPLLNWMWVFIKNWICCMLGLRRVAINLIRNYL